MKYLAPQAFKLQLINAGVRVQPNHDITLPKKKVHVGGMGVSMIRYNVQRDMVRAELGLPIPNWS